jgi:hypothetical protein
MPSGVVQAAGVQAQTEPRKYFPATIEVNNDDRSPGQSPAALIQT